MTENHHEKEDKKAGGPVVACFGHCDRLPSFGVHELAENHPETEVKMADYTHWEDVLFFTRISRIWQGQGVNFRRLLLLPSF